MYINLSRIGKSGTGMWQFSQKFIQSVYDLKELDGIICAETHAKFFIKYNCSIITVPDSVTNTSKTSLLRPLLWFLYSYFLSLKLFFESRGKMIVSTTHHGLPLISNQTITIHDLRPYNYPDSFMQKVYFKYLLPGLLKRCHYVLTVSRAVKKQIAECYSYPLDRISVVYNSINIKEFCEDQEKQPFLLAVGASWKHKNIHTLLDAHSLWQDKYRLIIVCGHTKYADFLQQRIVSLGLQNVVELRHEVSFSELKSLYAAASALIYPSIDEGFGIPPIEAMASGTPVIVSDIPVFHEVLGDAAIYVEPENLDSWRKAFPVLQKNSHECVKRGKEQIKLYDEANMSRMIAEWLKKVS